MAVCLSSQLPVRRLLAVGHLDVCRERVGLRRSQVLKPSTKESIEVVAFLSDIHVPYQDPGVVESALALVRDLQPHRVVINGDVCDFVSLSRFSTSLDRFINLQAEINEANEFRAAGQGGST